MNYNVELTDFFKRQFKRLARKYPSLKKELRHLVDTLKDKPDAGTSIGNKCYKIRLSIVSKGKGKSGGARVITHIYVARKKVYLLSIYDKSEQKNISPAVIESFLKNL